MTPQHIISWNCRGFFFHHEEYKILTQNYKPFVFCFQETKFNINQFLTFSDYDAYIKNYETTTVAKGGVMTLVSKEFSSSLVHLSTNLEAVAVRLYFPIKFTICNIYLRGSDSVAKWFRQSNSAVRTPFYNNWGSKCDKYIMGIIKFKHAW